MDRGFAGRARGDVGEVREVGCGTSAGAGTWGGGGKGLMWEGGGFRAYTFRGGLRLGEAGGRGSQVQDARSGWLEGEKRGGRRT